MLVTGQGRAQFLALIETTTGRVLDRLAFERPHSLSGAAVFSPAGTRVYVGGAGRQACEADCPCSPCVTHR
jgi:hypothetical protein